MGAPTVETVRPTRWTDAPPHLLTPTGLAGFEDLKGGDGRKNPKTDLVPREERTVKARSHMVRREGDLSCKRSAAA